MAEDSSYRDLMAIKLIAIDMDGTLLLPDHTISPAVKTAIAAARSRVASTLLLTTGRPYAGVRSYLKELHMEQPGDYCITYNGALVQKAKRRQYRGANSAEL